MASGSSCLSRGSEGLCCSRLAHVSADIRPKAQSRLCAPWRKVKKLCIVAERDEGFHAAEKGTVVNKLNDVAPAKNDKVQAKAPPRLQIFAETAATLERTADLKFWKVMADPFGELGVDPFLIWNRSAYDDFQRLIEDGLVGGYKRFIVLGTAGIGKSLFSIVWMMRLAAKGGCEVIIKTDTGYHVLDFRDKSNPRASHLLSAFDSLVGDALDVPSNWLIIDGEEPNRLGYECHVLQACSTKPTNYEEFGKHPKACRFFMPVWSKQEICKFLDDFELYREKYQTMGINDKESALKMYKKIGGVVRYVLQRRKSEEGLRRVKLAISKFGSNVDMALPVLAGGFISDLSDRLVHIFCRKGDYCNPYFDFATLEVKRLIIRQVQLASDVRLKAVLGATVFDPSFARVWGCCFEVLVHRIMTQGGVLKMKKVVEHDSGPVVTVTVKQHNLLYIEKMHELKDKVAAGNYVKPDLPNFPSVDSFLGEDVFIQVFKRVSGNHGYNVNGLMKIDEHLQRKKYQLWSCVPPEFFARTGYQKFTGKVAEQDAAKVADLLSKFEQYVVLVDYNSA